MINKVDLTNAMRVLIANCDPGCKKCAIKEECKNFIEGRVPREWDMKWEQESKKLVKE